MAWVGRLAHITLDTDDKESLQKFHIWKKRIHTLLYAHPWLTHADPFKIAALDSDCQKCYAHYDQLLYAALCDAVQGEQLESVVLQCTSGAQALIDLIERNESSHARASIGLLLEMVQLISWDVNSAQDPRKIIADITRINGRLNNLETPIKLPEELFLAILLGRFSRHLPKV